MRRSLTLTLVLALAVIAGCGGSSHPQVNPEAMLDSAAAHPIRSAQTEIDLRLQVAGVAQLSGPIRVRLEGPYVSGGGSRIPSFDWRFNASALGFPVGGHLLSTGSNAYLTVYRENYEIGTEAVAAANARVGELDLRPRDWFGRARSDGEGNEGGVDCERIVAPIRASALAGDLNGLAEMLGLSSPPSVRGTVRACVGFDDRVFHQLAVDADLGILAEDQAGLSGASSVHVELEVVTSDVGEPQHISAPAGSYRPIRDLALTLNDFGVPIP